MSVYSKTKEVKQGSKRFFATQIAVSSIDLFIAGLLLIAITITSNFYYTYILPRMSQDAENIDFLAIKIMTASTLLIVWGLYIVPCYLLFHKTIGEKIVGVQTKARYPLVARILRPLLVFDYLLGVKFVEERKRDRKSLYLLILILLSWWIYIIFAGLFLFLFLF